MIKKTDSEKPLCEVKLSSVRNHNHFFWFPKCSCGWIGGEVENEAEGFDSARREGEKHAMDSSKKK